MDPWVSIAQHFANEQPVPQPVTDAPPLPEVMPFVTEGAVTPAEQAMIDAAVKAALAKQK